MSARLFALLFPSIAKVHAETCRERDRLRLECAELRFRCEWYARELAAWNEAEAIARGLRRRSGMEAN